MCRSIEECSAARSKRRCDGTLTGNTDAARKARRGRDRALERTTAMNPDNVAVFPLVDQSYWREVLTTAAGVIIGTRAKRAEERAAYLAGTDDVNVVRLGLSDRRALVRVAAAQHPLAEEARKPFEVGPGQLNARDAQKIAKYRAYLEGRGDLATPAHWEYLDACEQHFRGLQAMPLSPEQEAQWKAEVNRRTGNDRARFVRDRYRQEWAWEAQHDKTADDFPTWWERKRRTLRNEAIIAGERFARPAGARIDWSQMSYLEADAAVRAGTIKMSAVPMDTPGWRLRQKWLAERQAEAGNEQVAHAIDLAATFNARPGRAKVRAIPHADGTVLVESLVGAPRKVATWIDLRGLDRDAATERFERDVATFWEAGAARAA